MAEIQNAPYLKHLKLSDEQIKLLEQWNSQAEQWYNQAIDYIHQIPPNQLYAALGVLVFTILFFLLSKFAHSHYDPLGICLAFDIFRFY